MHRTPTASATGEIDWRLALTTLADVVTVGLEVFTRWAEQQAKERARDSDASEDDEVTTAAALLGVADDATADEIRSALRAKLVSSRLHPDHGGDGEDAKRLIAAKNLLIERARSVYGDVR